jgi:hypothetical protein
VRRGPERGARRPRTVAELRRGIEHAGRQGRGGEAAGENPHRNAELLEHLLDSGEWPSGERPRHGGGGGGRALTV